MSAFEFLFSFYGLLLGLSAAVLATGAARAFKHRKTRRIGWLTPMLAVFVALDIATFWDAAWVNYRQLPFSYGLLIGGLVDAVVYFIAAALVFPDETDPEAPMDDHFWAHKRAALCLLILANVIGVCGQLAVNLTRENGQALVTSYSINLGIYVVLVGLAAWTRRKWLFGAAIGLHILIYLYIAVVTIVSPAPSHTPLGQATAEQPAAGKLKTAEAKATTYLASIAVPLGPDERLESFKIETWGVDVLAVCRFPPGWEITAGRSAAPSGVIAGQSSHGVTWLSDMKALEGVVLLSLTGPVQEVERREGAAVHPATFKGTANLDTGDVNREVALGHANVRLTPASGCP